MNDEAELRVDHLLYQHGHLGVVGLDLVLFPGDDSSLGI